MSRDSDNARLLPAVPHLTQPRLRLRRVSGRRIAHVPFIAAMLCATSAAVAQSENDRLVLAKAAAEAEHQLSQTFTNLQFEDFGPAPVHGPIYQASAGGRIIYYAPESEHLLFASIFDKNGVNLTGLAQEGETASGPSKLPEPTEAERRRAFEALRGRMKSPAMEKQAREAIKAGRDRFALEREAMAKRLGQALGLAAPDMKAIAAAGPAPATKTWVPLLFVSSSMPTEILRSYAAQIEKARGVMAFRGMPGGMTKVAPMAKLTAEMLRLDPGCEGPACIMRDIQVIVDPLVFRQHGVTRVPALAMIPGDPALPYCEREEESRRAAHVVYGDAALSGLLEEIARLGGKEEVRDAQSRLEGR